MNSRTLTAGVLLAIATLGLPACGTGPTLPAGGEPVSVRTLQGEWRLVSIGGQEIAGLLPEGANPPSVTIHPDGRLTGFSGINRISGTLDTSKLLSGGWSVGPMVSTKMAGPEGLMALESRVLTGLSNASGVSMDAGRLTLGGRNAEVLVFAHD